MNLRLWMDRQAPWDLIQGISASSPKVGWPDTIARPREFPHILLCCRALAHPSFAPIGPEKQQFGSSSRIVMTRSVGRAAGVHHPPYTKNKDVTPLRRAVVAEPEGQLRLLRWRLWRSVRMSRSGSLTGGDA